MKLQLTFMVQPNRAIHRELHVTLYFSYDYAFTKFIASCVTGVDSITADLKEQKLIIIGDMDAVAIAKKLKKIGKFEIVSVGPAKADTKEEEKKDNKK